MTDTDTWRDWRDPRCDWITLEGERCTRAITTVDYGSRTLCAQHLKDAENWIYWYLREHDGFFRKISREIHGDRWDARVGELTDPGRSVVYFIERDGLIKIGTTVNVPKRLQDISKGSSMIRGMIVGPVRLLGIMPGDRRHEDFLHRRFYDLRVDGEWFLPDTELVEFIKRRPDVDHDLLEAVAIQHGLAELHPESRAV